MTATTLTPVRHSILVEAPIEAAFRVFTAGFDRWWPRGHHIGKTPAKLFVIEQKQGGRCFEIGEDGVECDWGRIRLWEPPSRLIIAWHLNGQWQFDPDPQRASEADIRFVQETPSRTRVDLEHRHFERHGAGAESVHKGVGSPEGWSGILEKFRAVAASA